ncbi:MAG: energy transducer TonB [Sediminibacterium sp.]
MYKLLLSVALFLFNPELLLKEKNNKVVCINNSIGQNFYDTSKITASFPGGQQEWLNFIKKNLNVFIPVKNSAPIGKYRVVIQFNVAPDGTISNIIPLTNFGYGMEDEFIRVMKRSPKWEPAKENGQPVNTIEKKTQLFIVSTAM